MDDHHRVIHPEPPVGLTTAAHAERSLPPNQISDPRQPPSGGPHPTRHPQTRRPRKSFSPARHLASSARGTRRPPSRRSGHPTGRLIRNTQRPIRMDPDGNGAGPSQRPRRRIVRPLVALVALVAPSPPSSADGSAATDGTGSVATDESERDRAHVATVTPEAGTPRTATSAAALVQLFPQIFRILPPSPTANRWPRSTRSVGVGSTILPARSRTNQPHAPGRQSTSIGICPGPVPPISRRR